MKNNQRFKVEDIQTSGFSGVKILIDTVTGVNYLWYFIGQGAGLTPLLDSNGNIVVSSIDNEV